MIGFDKQSTALNRFLDPKVNHLGLLLHAATNSRPDLGSRLGMLQSQINRAKMSALIEANKVLHEAKTFAGTTLKIQPIPIDKLALEENSESSGEHTLG